MINHLQLIAAPRPTIDWEAGWQRPKHTHDTTHSQLLTFPPLESLQPAPRPQPSAVSMTFPGKQSFSQYWKLWQQLLHKSLAHMIQKPWVQKTLHWLGLQRLPKKKRRRELVIIHMQPLPNRGTPFLSPKTHEAPSGRLSQSHTPKEADITAASPTTQTHAPPHRKLGLKSQSSPQFYGSPRQTNLSQPIRIPAPAIALTPINVPNRKGQRQSLWQGHTLYEHRRISLREDPKQELASLTLAHTPQIVGNQVFYPIHLKIPANHAEYSAAQLLETLLQAATQESQAAGTELNLLVARPQEPHLQALWPQTWRNYGFLSPLAAHVGMNPSTTEKDSQRLKNTLIYSPRMFHHQGTLRLHLPDSPRSAWHRQQRKLAALAEERH